MTQALIKYLKEHRIELNTILAAAGPEAFWNWLSAKILKVWPKRDYRRAINLEERMQTPTMTRFNEWCLDQSQPIIADKVKEASEGLAHVEGFIDDVDDKKEEIEDDIRDNTLLKNKQIQTIDEALKIMNGDGNEQTAN